MSLGAPEHSAGMVLDRRYRLVSRLGQGGFGDVWRAEELLPDGEPFRSVALKVLTSDFAGAAWTEEAKLLASFRHASLVTIYAAGLLGEAQTPFVAMELLLGATLAEHVRRRRVSWRRALHWARDVAGALDVIHRSGVVHLDLKPANLFLTQDGAIKVLDFGISRKAGTQAPLREASSSGGDIALEKTTSLDEVYDVYGQTRPAPDSAVPTARSVVGSPGYVAPEMFAYQEPTAATDGYALAVCLTQLITRRFPQDVDAEPDDWTDAASVGVWWSALRSATIEGTLRNLRMDPANLPLALTELLYRLLASSPTDRGVVAGGLKKLLDEVWERPHGATTMPKFGLAPYGAEAEGTLFGREDEAGRLGRELSFETCLLLQGPVGVGKTSFALAGLVPHLARGMVDDKDDWRAVVLTPGSDPDAALSKALASIDPSLEEADAEALVQYCESSTVGFALFVDPMREICASDPDKRRRISALLVEIATWATDKRPRPRGLRLLGAVREDAAAELAADPELGPALRSALRYLGAPPAAAAKELVHRPAALAGHSIEHAAGLERALAVELRAGGVRVPVIAIVLSDFWAHQQAAQVGPGAALDGRSFTERGGVAGALSRHADRVRAELAPDDVELMCELLLRLSTTDAHAIEWSHDELVALFEDSTRARRLIARLSEQRLLVRQGDRVSIIHEALVDTWPPVVAARLESMPRLTFLERLREAAAAWERAGAHRELLWGDGPLGEVADSPEWTRHGISEREQEFLAASRRRARRRSVIRWSAAASILMTLVAVIVGQREMERAQIEAEAREQAAVKRAYVADVISRSRRTDDPYERVAWILEAVNHDAEEATLALDLMAAVEELPRAQIITLEPVEAATFPWDGRWLVGSGAGGTLTIVDLEPKPELPFGEDEDAEPVVAPQPVVTVLRPHEDPVAQREAFAFDTALATRSVSGEVRVWRLRDSGDITLAAVAPMRCSGAMKVATKAPVIVCPTEAGLARWDLRHAEPDESAFRGSVLDVSADGERVAASIGKRALIWEPDSKLELEHESEHAVMLGRWSPRDRAIALVSDRHYEIVVLEDEPRTRFRGEIDVAPASARWSPAGIDLAICSASGLGDWHYLRRGGRVEPPPVTTRPGEPCAPPLAEGMPTRLRRFSEFAELADLDVGRHLSGGGFRLPDGRWLTETMLLFEKAEPAAHEALEFVGKGPGGGDEPTPSGASVHAVVAVGEDQMAFQVGEEVRVYRRSTGERGASRKGNLLGRCDDGGLLSWRSDGETFELSEVLAGRVVAEIPREPAFIVGVDGACTTLYTQRLDGALVATSIADPTQQRTLAQADGYVFESHSSPPRGGVSGATLLALSSGAIARLDWQDHSVRVLGYATPRATALGEGISPGEVIYADATGVVRIAADGTADKLLAASPLTEWADVAVSSSASSVLLISADRMGVLDVDRRELTRSYRSEGRDRFSPWDGSGSMIAWSFDRVGGAEGRIVPWGRELANEVGSAVSNLRVSNRVLHLGPPRAER